MATPRILVTGGSKRIGRSICNLFHRKGFNVAIHYNHSDREAFALAEEMNAVRPSSAMAFQADLRSIESVQELPQRVVEETSWGGLDVLINNASCFYPTPVGEVTSAAWEDLMSTNAQANLFLTQASVPFLEASSLKGGGAVVNVIDIYSEKPLSEYIAYSASKAAQASVTKSLARELAPRIRVNGVSPGAILWPEADGKETMSARVKAKIIKSVPLKRKGEPEDIANAAFFLASAPYITGQILAVDGGRSVVMG